MWIVLFVIIGSPVLLVLYIWSVLFITNQTVPYPKTHFSRKEKSKKYDELYRLCGGNPDKLDEYERKWFEELQAEMDKVGYTYNNKDFKWSWVDSE